MASFFDTAHMVLRDIKHAYRPMPLPPSNTFAGKVICITGSTTGLGLAAAQHFADLGAQEIILTTRNEVRGMAAEQFLRTMAFRQKKEFRSKITVLELEMSRYSSVVAFVNKLKRVRAGAGGIDYILLNAGVIQSQYALSPEGWQEEIQVNTLSTVLIATLLLPWLKEEGENRDTPAHLGFCTSGEHWQVDTTDWPKWAAEEGLLNHWNKRENWPVGLNGGYKISKLMLMYSIREISKLALNFDGRWVTAVRFLFA